MRIPSSGPKNCLLLSSILFPTFIAAVGNLDCNEILSEGQHWDLHELGGPRSVMESHKTAPTIQNITYTIDICRPLKPDSSVKKGEKCFSGTRVCAIQHTIKPDDNTDDITEVIPIAGDLSDHGGGPLDAHITRLKTSDSNADSKKEGVRIELNGGIYGDDKRKQKAIIEFICDPERTGTETDLVPEDKYTDGGDEKRTLGVSSLQLVGYDRNLPDTDTDVLRLEWYTKFACEKQADEGNSSPSGHWGFFTWFLIIAFLLTAAYLIFGSWLNYNRYGARGWDLLPHGDTIRDVPYLLKDWTRKVVNTVQGSGSRGGYSAV